VLGFTFNQRAGMHTHSPTHKHTHKRTQGEIGDKTKAEFKMIFNFIDKNNDEGIADGHITESELAKVMTTVFNNFKTKAAAKKEKGNMSGETGEQWEKWEKNMSVEEMKKWINACVTDKNKKLELGEFENLIAPMKHGDGEFGEMGQKVYGHLLMLAHFDLYDVDGDGNISEKEYYGSKLNFDNLDQDGNALITLEEFNATFTKGLLSVFIYTYTYIYIYMYIYI
jgi:Ca2+-binding EF-hand superfamily protein